jgi:glycosyltransferase involved in cell wall biosynthesis
LRAKLGASDKFLLLSIGRIVPSKNLELAIRALALLPARIKLNCRLCICGPGDTTYESSLAALARELEVADIVSFYGRISEHEKAEFLCAADAFVFPSDNEGFGIVVLEAVTAGLPVLASHIGTVASFARAIPSVYLLDPQDLQAWRTPRAPLKSDSDESMKFRWSGLADKVIKTYEKAITPPKIGIDKQVR